jgi:hypothetical protein
MSKSKIVRATAEVKHVPNKQRPGQSHGFQTCRLVDADGGYQEFSMYFDPSKVSLALAPGDYEIKASEVKVVKERFVIYPEFVPLVAEGKKAA